jgi:hypothetical protein
MGYTREGEIIRDFEKPLEAHRRHISLIFLSLEDFGTFDSKGMGWTRFRVPKYLQTF